MDEMVTLILGMSELEMRAVLLALDSRGHGPEIRDDLDQTRKIIAARAESSE